MIAIRTENLSKYYGKIKALDNLNLEVPDNVVFGFLGPNGAGKTTTVKLLTGFSRPTTGTAWVADEKIGDGNLALQAKTGCRLRRILILTRDISCALNGEESSAEELERARKVSVNLLQWAMRARLSPMPI